ncbi:aminoglycoside adenylyltransferase [Streptomyces sp. NPDC057445]|uniref:aminoglycoside adenylyltransferase n=1 Tax=Streptomyces sp. NPDC057445 TaxID=3346136 RepID=UPI0036B2D0E6
MAARGLGHGLLYLGEVTRDHKDIDWFVRAEDSAELTGALLRHGFEPVTGPPPDLQADFAKDGLDSSFAFVAEDAAGRLVVAGGPWAGAPWPEGMLDAEPGRIGGLECAVVSPPAQIEIKEMMPVWVPGAPRRAKDAEDIVRLRTAMAERARDSARPTMSDHGR